MDFFESVYDFCSDNFFISRGNKHVVVGHSVMEIKQAIVNVTNYCVKYSDGKYRQHTRNKEKNINVNADIENIF